MGGCATLEYDENKKKSKEIEIEISRHKKLMNKEMKILLLGFYFFYNLKIIIFLH